MVDNIDPEEVWQRLRSDPAAHLVDVRTDAEWHYVGIPDLSEAGKEVVLIPWQVYPGMQVNGTFLDQMGRAGLRPEHAVFFLCRSGARSLAAARAARAAGFGSVFNVADGFEGPHDDDGHRGAVFGWKAAGLPWRQG